MVRFDCLNLSDKTTYLQKLLPEKYRHRFLHVEACVIKVLEGISLTLHLLRTNFYSLSAILTILASSIESTLRGFLAFHIKYVSFEALVLFSFALSGNGSKYASQGQWDMAHTESSYDLASILAISLHLLVWFFSCILDNLALRCLVLPEFISLISLKRAYSK